eukprot:CAMPEP_0176488920 /NCGR_PEP_ID=MMETSP0200_2-20121128/6986_1 /TAXON_ID=947934 /ORGANISM="Chaetoceros sp., Strain GSL56" /LENGTH=530 /DNA_ID=CAMNT_0017885975 /DNA_START=29 /DNA_END=1621 /DNA_ORIENTATION=-
MDLSFDDDAFKEINNKRLKRFSSFEGFKHFPAGRRSASFRQGQGDPLGGGFIFKMMPRPMIKSPNDSERSSQSLKCDDNSSRMITPVLKRKHPDATIDQNIQCQHDVMLQQTSPSAGSAPASPSNTDTDSPSAGGSAASPSNTDTEKILRMNEQNSDEVEQQCHEMAGDAKLNAGDDNITNIAISAQDSSSSYNDSNDDDSTNGNDGGAKLNAGDDNLTKIGLAAQDSSDDSNDDDSTNGDDELDDDEQWRIKKISSMSPGQFKSLHRHAVRSFSDDESSIDCINGSGKSSKLASQPNVSACSLKALAEKQRHYNNAINIDVRSKRYAAKLCYPDLFLPEEYHHGFFKFMESQNAYQLCTREKWTNVVNVIIAYLLKMTVRHLAKKEPNFPSPTSLISVRNLFKMWYCNVFCVKVDYCKGIKGRGRRYTEEEILAIEFGMYKYPARNNGGSNNSLDFRWSSILADEELKEILKHHSKQGVIDKATIMCKGKVWDSLVFFYCQQQKLVRKIHDVQEKFEKMLDEDSDMEDA